MRRLASRTIRASWASGASPDSRSPSKTSVGRGGGHLAGLGAAHAVGDREEGRLQDQRVLVGAALAPDVGAARLLDDPESHDRPLFLVAVFAVADSDHVGHLEPLGRLDLAAVEVGPVGRAHVLHVHEVAAREDARMRR